MAERRILETTQLLGALPPEALESLRTASTVREVARNEVLFRRGDDAMELFGIVSGGIRVQIVNTAGTVLGSSAIASGGSYTVAFASPLSDGTYGRHPRAGPHRCSCSTTKRCLPRSRPAAALDHHPQPPGGCATDDTWPMRCSRRSRPHRQALLELSGGEDEFRLRMTQEDLAGLVGASRERVNKALSMFTRLGWLSVEGRNRYQIHDRVALEDRAEV
jgi:CRP-like cAMP-binding protein